MNKKQKSVYHRILFTVVWIVALLIGQYLHWFPTYVTNSLLVLAYGVIGYDVLWKAAKGIRYGQVFDENFLMAIATIGALALQEYLEAVAVLLFYQIGELFQSIAVGKSRRSIAKLMDIRPDTAFVKQGEKVIETDPEEIEIGSILVVHPGEKIAIDGVIIKGNTTLDTSALTGESLPQEVKEQDVVYSGSINMRGCIEVKTTKHFAESTVSKILDLVENSSMKKARTEHFITRFAKLYTPAVCYGALALAVLPPLYLFMMQEPTEFASWLHRALTFLVISCPCALVISIPLSFFGGIGCASSHGILVKGSNYLEQLSHIKTIVFDKTGTLTKGVFEVSEIHNIQPFTKTDLLYYAAHAEEGSHHPISESLQKAYGKTIQQDKIQHMQEIAGHGIEAIVKDHSVWIGNAKMMKKHQIQVPQEPRIGTCVHIAVDATYAGYIVIADIIKPTARKAIQACRKQGIRHIVLLSGDRKENAVQIGTELGMDEIIAEVLPAEKVTKVEALLQQQKENEKLAFVGDGINDAPVLTRADVGIAMGALGSDAAIEAADIVLMDDDPEKIATAILLARKTLQIVKQNIVFALGVKFLCLFLGAIGFANMWLAIFADVGVSILAILNATRALHMKFRT